MKRPAMVVAVLALGACGWLPNHTLDYRKATSVKPMDLPEDMVLIGEESLYPVPDNIPGPEYEDEGRDEAPLPPRMEIVEQDAEQDVPAVTEPEFDPTKTSVVMVRDGNGYPIIMMGTSFSWAWEHVSHALAETDLNVTDRNRDAGLFWLKVPKTYGVEGNRAQLKLSYTANGIQIAVLDDEGVALLAKEPGQKIIQQLYDRL